MPGTIEIDMRKSLATFGRMLTELETQQLPFAISQALNDTASAAQKAVTAEMPAIFDRPKAFTQNALVMKPASKTNLTALVTLKDKQAAYLLLEETGGTRTPDETTKGSGAALVVAPTLKLNSFGNIPDATVSRLIAKATKDRQDIHAAVVKRRMARIAKLNAGKRAKFKAAKRTLSIAGLFYVGRDDVHPGPSWMKGGVYQRRAGHHLAHLIAFAATENFKPRFGYRDRIMAGAADVFDAALQQRLAAATQEWRG
ncbi:MAG: hypothetical protein ACRYHQ_01775 [Janthinobacterium lividum]